MECVVSRISGRKERRLSYISLIDLPIDVPDQQIPVIPRCDWSARPWTGSGTGTNFHHDTESNTVKSIGRADQVPEPRIHRCVRRIGRIQLCRDSLPGVEAAGKAVAGSDDGSRGARTYTRTSVFGLPGSAAWGSYFL